MERLILHSDLNNFYASVECLYNPEIRSRPVAVCGDTEKRNGIVLAKNYLAKNLGVKTGEAIWQAQEKCRDLVVMPPSYDKYLHFSEVARDIYSDYTDQIEPFGIDECWIDITGSKNLFGNGKKVADEIRQRIRTELGVTASVGVSFNKIFAKLGSDMKKPDATTVIGRDDFKEKVWPLPVSELLYVGPATNAKLARVGISTIGDLAKADIAFLKYKLGKWGVRLWTYANGEDSASVSLDGAEPPIDSIGNSKTAIRDLKSVEDVKIVMCWLAESVAERLRKQNLLCRTVQIWVRDNRLEGFERQITFNQPTNLSTVILDKAMELYKRHHLSGVPIRSVGVRATKLSYADDYKQLSFIDEINRLDRLEKLENTIDNLRDRFGRFSIQRGLMLKDKELTAFDPVNDHIVHPVAFRK